MMSEAELTDAIASLRRTAQSLRADRRIESALELEDALAAREAELAALRAA